MDAATETPARRSRRMLQPIKDEIRRQREVALAEAAYWRAKYDEAVAQLGGEIQQVKEQLEGEAKCFGAGFLCCGLLGVALWLVFA